MSSNLTPTAMAQTLDLRKKPAAEEPKPAPPAEAVSWTAVLSSVPNKRNAMVMAGVLFAAAVLVAYFARDFLFTAVLVLAGSLLILSAYKNPDRASVTVDASGVTVRDTRYFYSQIKTFWVNYEPPYTKELIVTMRKPYLPVLRIPLADADPLKIRKIMVSLVPETEHEDSLLDQIVKRLTV